MGQCYGQLSLEEREEIAFQLRSGSSQRAIARSLGRSVSTVSREIARNTKATKQWPKLGEERCYTAARAQSLSRRRQQRNKSRFKLVRQPELLSHVVDRLAMGWSPQQIAGRLALENGACIISHESIYRYIYHRAAQGEKLHHLLARKRSRRRPPGTGYGKGLRFGRSPQKSIDQRSRAANERTQQGHWEVDLMLFSRARFGLLVAVERRSRFLILKRHDTRATRPTIDALIDIFKPLPPARRRSVTFDQGKEFWDHPRLEEACKMQTFFCQPRSPWQKGSVENTIGRLRRTLPRKTDLDAQSPSQLRAIVTQYNNQPRACINFKTPKEQNQTVALAT